LAPHSFIETGDGITRRIPSPHHLGGNNPGKWSLLMPEDRFVERDIKVIAACDPKMIRDESEEHFRIVTGLQNAVQDNMKSVVQSVAGGKVDQANIGMTWHVGIVQDVPADQISGDPRNSPPVSLANPLADRALPGSRVPPDHDEPCLRAACHMPLP
jgi:hypothetical protein